MEQTSEFVLFGPAHVTTLIAIALTCVAVAALTRGRPSRRVDYGIAAGLIVQEVLKLYFYIGVVDLPWQTNLPLHLCRINELLCVVMLVTRSYRVFEVSYFLAMSGSVSAMLTPALTGGFPGAEFPLFFFGHGLVVIAVVYAIAAYGFEPRPRSLLVALGATGLYALLIAPINLLLDANYLFLRAPPEPDTVLSLLGPWPVYLFALLGLAITVCVLAYLPFGLVRWWRRRRGSREPGRGSRPGRL